MHFLIIVVKLLVWKILIFGEEIFMNVAICDDDLDIVKKINEEIRNIFRDLKEEVQIYTFTSGIGLVGSVEEDYKNYDIILLDIDMPGISGLDVAKKLRDNNDDVIIVFVSSHEKYVFDSLEYRPFRYIRKNRIMEELKLAIRAACVLYKKNAKKYILIKTDDGEYRIEQSDIYYIEMVKRKLHIHLTDNKVLAIWKSMKDFYKNVENEEFVKIHSGCAVNIKYIREYSKYDVTIDNGEKLLASRSGIKELKENLARYWSERL